MKNSQGSVSQALSLTHCPRKGCSVLLIGQPKQDPLGNLSTWKVPFSKAHRGAACVDGPPGEVKGGPEPSNVELKCRPRQMVWTTGVLEEPDPRYSLGAMCGDPGP